MSTETTTPSVTLHTVMLHTDSSKPANASERLSVIRWKATKDEAGKSVPAKHATRCVSVPRVSLTVEPAILRDALTAAFNDTQDDVIRSLIEEHLAREPNAATFTLSSTQINAEAVASFYAESELTGRLNKALLETWFDTSLSSALATAFAKKNNIVFDPNGPVPPTISKVLVNYRSFIAGLSAPRASYSETVLVNIEKAISLADETDPLRNQLLAKITKLRTPKEQLLADTL